MSVYVYFCRKVGHFNMEVSGDWLSFEARPLWSVGELDSTSCRCCPLVLPAVSSRLLLPEGPVWSDRSVDWSKMLRQKRAVPQSKSHCVILNLIFTSQRHLGGVKQSDRRSPAAMREHLSGGVCEARQRFTDCNYDWTQGTEQMFAELWKGHLCLFDVSGVKYLYRSKRWRKNLSLSHNGDISWREELKKREQGEFQFSSPSRSTLMTKKKWETSLHNAYMWVGTAR